MFVAAILAAFLSARKNRDYSFWVACSFIFPPSVLILALMPKHVGERRRRPTLDEEERRPFLD